MMQKHKETSQKTRPKLEIVLKCDSVGTVEAVTHALREIALPRVDIVIIRSGVGEIGKSDILLAETGSRLIVGFQVNVARGTERLLKEHRTEVRLYDVIYTLVGDIKALAEGLIPREAQEEILGSAGVIALFKSSRKGIILGCEVQKGILALGQRFRVISAVGPVYSGTVESLHIGKEAVQKATPGQQVGIRIRDFNKARIGDLVESFRPLPQKVRIWEPRGEIMRK